MIAVIILVVLLVVVVAWAVLTYNGLVKLRNLVQEAWRQIDVELTRRHDLIGNLVETVKGYAAHERGTLEDVVKARSAAMAPGQSPAAQAESENMLSQALGRLLAIVEAYPGTVPLGSPMDRLMGVLPGLISPSNSVSRAKGPSGSSDISVSVTGVRCEAAHQLLSRTPAAAKPVRSLFIRLPVMQISHCSI